MKEVDTGVAASFRDVQGLSGGGQEVERKKALMSDIFQANLALQKSSGERQES